MATRVSDTYYFRRKGNGGGGGGSSDAVLYTEQSLSDAQQMQARDNIYAAENPNREYDSQDPNGMGYLVLEKDKTFAEQVTDINTIYEIRYQFNIADAEVTIPSGSELHFNGGSIVGGTINLNGANLSGDVLITSEPDWDANNEFLEDYKPSNKSLAVEWFGAKGDGITDDADSIIRAIRFLHKNGAELVFKAGCTYILGDGIKDLVNDPEMTKHTGYSYDPTSAILTGDWSGINDRPAYVALHPANIGRETNLIFFRFSNLSICGNGATIKSHDGNGYCRNNGIFKFYGCRGVAMSNLTVDGNRENRSDALLDIGDYNIGNVVYSNAPIFTTDSYKDFLDMQNAWYSIGLRDISSGYREVDNIKLHSCQNFVIKNVVSKNSINDGIYVFGYAATESRGIIIRGCESIHNSRHNITFGGTKESRVENSIIAFAGLSLDGNTEIYGTTCSNIDSEGESDVNLFNVFDGNTFGDTAKNNFVVTSNTRNCLISHNRFLSTRSMSGLNLVCQKGAFMNEVCYNILENCAISFVQEGSYIHHNHIAYTDWTREVVDITGYTYNKDYVYGEIGVKYCSIVPSRFHYNVIECNYTQQPTVPSIGMRMNYNIDMEGNIFRNLIGTTRVNLAVRRFVNNTIDYDTTSYPWLTTYNATLKAFASPVGEIEINDNSTQTYFYYIRKVNGSYRDYTVRVNEARPLWLQIHSFNFIGEIVTKQYKTDFRLVQNVASLDGTYMVKMDNMASIGVTGYYHYNKPAFIYLPYISGGGVREIHLRIFSLSNSYTDDFSILTTEPDVSGYREANDVSRGVAQLPSFQPIIYTQPFVVRDKSMLAIYDPLSSKYWAVKVADIYSNTVGTTAERPTASAVGAGFTYFDTDLGKMIVSNGTAWVNVDGTAL